MTIWGYVRKSKDKQDTANQREIIRNYVEYRYGKPYMIQFIEESISGTVIWEKRQLSQVLSGMKKDDLIVVSELSRLGRSMFEIMEILSIVIKRGVKLYAVKSEFTLTDNLQSKVLAFAFSIAAEVERELISFRTKEALSRKRKEGIRGGHKKGEPGHKKLTGMEFTIRLKLEEGLSKEEIARQLGVSRITVYRHLSFMRSTFQDVQ